MTIRVKCPACQQTLKAEPRYAGRTVRCPACRSSVTIPELETRSAEETLDPFAGLAENSLGEQLEQSPPVPSRPRKQQNPDIHQPAEPSRPPISEEEVGEWLFDGDIPLKTPDVEVIELPPQSPNWDGTASTYDVTEMGPDHPPTWKKRRKKS